MRESETFGREIFEAIVDRQDVVAVIVLDENGKILRWNKGAQAITGYSADDVVGENISLLFTPEDDALGVSARELKMALETGKSEDVRWHVRADGRRFWAEGVVTRLASSDGKFIGLCKFFRDSSLRKQTEEKLHRLNVNLSQFSSAAAHDLQEPLRTVSTYVHLLSTEYRDKLDARGQGFVQFIIEGAKRMRTLISDLLDYSQSDESGEFAHETVQCNSAVDLVNSSLKALIDEKKAVVTRAALPLVRGSASQLAHVFENLIANAIKYSGDRAPVVSVSVEEKPEHWIFCVRDNGIGIDPTKLKDIFLPFRRLHPNHPYPGTGLGLAICQRIIDRHGGKIWAESEKDRGSSFFFTLPKQTRKDG